MDTYFAYDVETANYDYSTICQIGLVKFEDGQVVESWDFLINPQTEDFMFTCIHGITYNMVENKPTFNEIYPRLLEIIGNNFVIHHTAFDKYATQAACEAHQQKILDFSRWIDSAKMVRRTFPEFTKKGYGLKNIAQQIGIEFNHHNACEDARAAGLIAWFCCKEKGISISEWQKLDKRPIHLTTNSKDIQELIKNGNPEGELYGENLVFTGTLSLPRTEASYKAALAGCKIQDGINKQTTILVVGIQDHFTTGHREKSSKQIKAEKLIQQGQNIKIISENDFIKIISLPER